MDVLWSKDKLHKIFSKDSLPMTINAHASGDGCVSVRVCKLCDGDTSLRSFNETYMCEGIEERYDQLLYDCFGVRVPQRDCMICEHCVRQLRNINRFRSLVHAAFVKQRSQYSSKHSQLGTGEGHIRHKTKPKQDDNTANRVKEVRVIKLRKGKSKSIDVPKRREIRRDHHSSELTNKAVIKRIILTCIVCRQRYPMIVPFEGWREFICSRCKKKKQVRNVDRCKLKMAPSVMRERLVLNSKADMKGRSGLSCSSKRSTHLSKTEVPTRVRQPKYQCSLCPKKYIVAQHLAHHMSTVHGDKQSFECSICNKDLTSKDALDIHTRMHTGQPVYQCDVCLRTFKGKRSFQAHYLTHAK